MKTRSDYSYVRKHSRGQKLCNIARQSQSESSIFSANTKNEQNDALDSDSLEHTLKAVLPQSDGADLIELEELERIFGQDLDRSKDCNTTNGNDTVEDLIEILNTPQSSKTSNTPQIRDLGDQRADTPHPSSPECSINHLDEDCNNDFCPYFIGRAQPMTPQSTFSGYSTPQANTPVSCDSSITTPVERKTNKRKDIGNIRRRHEKDWIDTKRKTLRNLGKEYVSRKGVVKPRRIMKLPCKCRMKCFEKILSEQRYKIFNCFWNLGDHRGQWQYISNLVDQVPKRRVYTDATSSRRKYTLKYKLPLPATEPNKEIHFVDVCKTQFLSTLSISEQFVYTAIGKTDASTGDVAVDKRGKHKNHPRKITEDVTKSVCAHIRCLQPVESHYVRKDSSKLYLDGNLNFHKLFKLYSEWYDSNLYQDKAETERQYKTIVDENFKLSFFKPKKDQCDTCHKYKNIEIPTEEARKAQSTHISNKNLARELKNEDKKVAVQSNGKIVSATFDFQKVLSSPSVEVNILYYKRKLGTMNFTLFDLAEKMGFCYMWHEGEGKRGANEVATCLADFVAKKVESGATEFRFWSDNCAGQNRNRIVFAAYMTLAEKYKVTIKHTFLEKGHTQQEGDSVHALIERSSNNKTIYCPAEWCTLVRWAKQDGKPYTVIEMDHTSFYDYKSELNNKNWTKNIKGENVQWSKIKELKVSSDDSKKILYKYDLSEKDYLIISTKSSIKRRRAVIVADVKPLYASSLRISKEKKGDLLSLCEGGTIPLSYHNFYKGLLTGEETNCDNNLSDSE